jgi:hypothetical protein
VARTQKDVVSYFPHDANACSGDTLTVLQSRFGNDGYAFWFKLLEKLASTDGHYLDCRNSTKWQLLLAKTGVNEITGVEIMKLLVEMQAIDEELWQSSVIWCQKLVENIADVYKNRRREIPQKPVITNGNALTTQDNGITTGESTQSKESKVKKVKNIISTNFDIFWKEYPRKEDKAKALRAFTKLNPNNGLLETMLSAIEATKKSGKWKDPQFIPLPTTWLNGKRWEDELPKGGQGGTNRGDIKTPTTEDLKASIGRRLDTDEETQSLRDSIGKPLD